MTEQDRWADGWAFYVDNGKPRDFLPLRDDCLEWIKGYGAALADYDLEPYREFQSIEAALVDHGLTSELLEACLLAAEEAFESDEWFRWPSVPVRKKDEQRDRHQNFVI